MFYNLVKTSVSLINSHQLLHFEPILFLQFDLNELLFIIAAALLLTLCIEMPVKNLRNSFARERQLKTPAKLLEKKLE